MGDQREDADKEPAHHPSGPMQAWAHLPLLVASSVWVSFRRLMCVVKTVGRYKEEPGRTAALSCCQRSFPSEGPAVPSL